MNCISILITDPICTQSCAFSQYITQLMALSKQNEFTFCGKCNFATSIYFLTFDGELLKSDIYLMKVITEVDMCVLDA